MNEIKMNIIKENRLILLSTSGKLQKSVDLEMLSFSIHFDDNIYKFIGYGDISYSKEPLTKLKTFYNQCSFFFDKRKSIKIYGNGSYHTSGFLSVEEANSGVQYILDNFINKKKCIKIGDEIKIIYNCSDNNISSVNINLIHYLITIDSNYIFSKYHIKNFKNYIDDEDKDKFNIIIIKDIFKYASTCVVIDKLGDINFFKSSLTIPCKSTQAFNTLYIFIKKYIHKLIIPKYEKNELINLLNTI